MFRLRFDYFLDCYSGMFKMLRLRRRCINVFLYSRTLKMFRLRFDYFLDCYSRMFKMLRLRLRCINVDVDYARLMRAEWALAAILQQRFAQNVLISWVIIVTCHQARIPS